MTSTQPTGVVFDMQSLSTHDGPGIRTVVFLKGCPLRCRWCSNPEGIRGVPELRVRRAACERCGQCVSACPRQLLTLQECGPALPDHPCVECDEKPCLDACPTRALTWCGRNLDVPTVLRKLRQDQPYYRAAGGVTLSGGEPLVQHEFCAALLSAARDDGIHSAVETAGQVPWDHVERVAGLTDLFLFDVKHLDPDKHRRWTGRDNTATLGNLSKLAALGADITVRMPVISGFNDDPAHAERLGAWMRASRLDRMSLLAFHGLGGPKYDQIAGDAWTLEHLRPPSRECLEALASAFQQQDVACVIEGLPAA